MERVWLSSTYYMDPAVEELSPNAERLMTRALAYCGNAETEGALTLKAAKKLGISAVIRRLSELIGAGILVETDDPETYRFAAWDKWQASGNELVRRKKADAERQARKRQKDREGDQMSRDTSRDVTPTEKRREEKEKTNHLPESSHVSIARPPRGGRAIADHLNATAHSGEAHAIARAYETRAGKVPGDTLSKIAQAADGCLASGYTAQQIDAGIDAWAASDMHSPSQIPNFVHKAVSRPAATPGGFGQASKKAASWLAIGQELAEHELNAITRPDLKEIS